MTENVNQTVVLNFATFESNFDALRDLPLTQKQVKKVYRGLDLAQKAQKVINKLNFDLAKNSHQKIIVEGLATIDNLLGRILQGQNGLLEIPEASASRRSSVNLDPAQMKKFRRAQALLALAESALLAAAADPASDPSLKNAFLTLASNLNALLTHKNIGMASFHFRKAVES